MVKQVADYWYNKFWEVSIPKSCHWIYLEQGTFQTYELHGSSFIRLSACPAHEPAALWKGWRSKSVASQTLTKHTTSMVACSLCFQWIWHLQNWWQRSENVGRRKWSLVRTGETDFLYALCSRSPGALWRISPETLWNTEHLCLLILHSIQDWPAKLYHAVPDFYLCGLYSERIHEHSAHDLCFDVVSRTAILMLVKECALPADIRESCLRAPSGLIKPRH